MTDDTPIEISRIYGRIELRTRVVQEGDRLVFYNRAIHKNGDGTVIADNEDRGPVIVLNGVNPASLGFLP